MVRSCLKMSDDMRFPHTADDWKMKKKMPKYWLMTSDPFLPSLAACEFPAMVRYVHLADHRGEPPIPRITEVGMRVYLWTGEGEGGLLLEDSTLLLRYSLMCLLIYSADVITFFFFRRSDTSGTILPLSLELLELNELLKDASRISRKRHRLKDELRAELYGSGKDNLEPETRDQRLETRDQRSETRDQRPGTRDQRPETRD
ncbi:hypothetical protein EYF80_033665 [Liparis tanakae]|uniref:Uncharacterized protein n=1 Tax=Liparis tanakae TaxID=230148 RepID=A0A4Z2GSM2_9TELE|nr:hypothetical protein EYF80_033665 [Liparis tanakae]